MTDFQRPEHRTIAHVLRLMDPTLLMSNRCWFAGGTAIVMMYGEYRRSLDVDFLCADMDGYRALRSLAVEKGVGGLFAAPVTALREVRADQYGLRALLSLDEQTIRFEIVRESRIPLDGMMNVRLGVPVLSPSDMMAEKLLANADRCQDRAVAYRDAIDLGMLIDYHGAISQDAVTKVENAYGGDIGRKALWVVDRLADGVELQHVCDALQMKREDAAHAVAALSREVLRFWPTS